MALNLRPPAANISFTDHEDWIPESPALRLEVYLEGQNEPEIRIPDGLFRLQVPRGRFNFVLEIQRSNTEKKRFLPRLQACWKYSCATTRKAPSS